LKELIQKLEAFFKTFEPVIIVNASTDDGLLCLNPTFEIVNEMIMMKFDSMNERGSSIYIKSIQGIDEKAVFVENEVNNVLMLSALELAQYNHYIQPMYSDTPDFYDEEEMKKYIRKQAE